MQQRKPNNRPRKISKKQRLKRRLYFLIFFLICIGISFSCGKMVGRAKKQVETSARKGKDITEESVDGNLNQDNSQKSIWNKDSQKKGKKKNSSNDSPEIIDVYPDGQSRENGYGMDDYEDNNSGFKRNGSSWKEEEPQEDILILVNRDNPLPEDYRVELVTLNDGVHKSAKIAYSSLSEMLTAGVREGLTFEICSAYRSVKRQKELFDEDLNALLSLGYSYDSAYEEVAKETMPPGCSEHSTGLAFDIVSFEYQQLNRRQAQTKENIWLREHCAEYGFILRYPEDKEDITGIRYESWHFRYVGKEAAEKIMEQGITLEEYLEGLEE